MIPLIRSGLSSASELLESSSFSNAIRPRLEDLLAVMIGEKEKASSSFAFKGPRIDKVFRRKVIARDASSRRSLGVTWFVWHGWIRSALISSIWNGRGAKVGLSWQSGWDAPDVTRSVRRVRALISNYGQSKIARLSSELYRAAHQGRCDNAVAFHL
jgi:hypothetical protein